VNILLLEPFAHIWIASFSTGKTMVKFIVPVIMDDMI
jgi:hypothetical protein